MFSYFASLFHWMPPMLETLCIGVTIIFFIATVLRVVKFILDIIPFL